MDNNKVGVKFGNGVPKKMAMNAMILFRMKAFMKEVLNHGQSVLQEKQYKSFKSHIMYSTYFNFRELMNSLVELGLVKRSDCNCKLERKRTEQDFTCKCSNTEYINID